MAINVLVADDSVVVRSVILKTLRLCDVELGETHQARDGHEALELLAQNWIDVAILDINMPRMNGEEVIEALRQNPLWADLPVIVVSTEGSETRIARLKQLGVRFIHKPFEPETLRNVVLEVIGAEHAQRP